MDWSNSKTYMLQICLVIPPSVRVKYKDIIRKGELYKLPIKLKETYKKEAFKSRCDIITDLLY